MSLVLEHVDLRYGRQMALDDVSLEVRRGDCYGFIGHNGAGKTTAMRVLLGLVRPDSGRVLIDGFEARRHPREARARMGALIERPGFFDSLDGRRNLLRLARLQGLDAAAARREAERLLGQVGLAQAGGKRVGAYSQGMRQRLGIAQALLGSPDFVLLDEPGNGLDPEGLAEMRALIRRLVEEEGLTVLLSSHQLHEVEEICNRIGVLKQGRLVLEAEARELFRTSGDRWRLLADDEAAAGALLEGMGLRAAAARGGGLDLDLGDRPSGEVVRALVQAGIGVTAMARRSPSLEDIYLGAEGRAHAELAPRETGEPPELKAPGLGTGRMLSYELKRLFGSYAGWGATLAPAVLGGLSVWRFAAERSRVAAEMAAREGGFFERTTAFEAVSKGLAPGAALLYVVAAALAGLSLSGELGSGTLRNVLLRPLRRSDVVFGKLLGLGLQSLAAFALLLAAVLGLSIWYFDFVGLAEVLPNGELYELVPASELWPELRRALWSPLPPLLAAVSLGFLGGSLARNGVVGLVTAVLSIPALDLLRAFLVEAVPTTWFDLAKAVPPSRMASAYMSRFDGDATSFLARYDDLATGASNAREAFVDSMATVPLVWAAVATLLALLRFWRRSVT